MMSVINYKIYVSTSTKLFSEAELEILLQQSRKFNEDHQITGVLLYNKGTFFQILEGESEQLQLTFERIKSDPRHKNIINLKTGTLAHRNFPDWSMGFTTSIPGSLKHIPGFVEPARKEFLEQCNSSHPEMNLLKSFTLANNFAF